VRQWPGRKEEGGRMKEEQEKAPPSPSSFHMLGLVASTGGPRALATVLGALPRTFPLPLLVVQHITASFLAGFVAWLGTVCPFPVALAGDHEAARPGRV